MFICWRMWGVRGRVSLDAPRNNNNNLRIRMSHYSLAARASHSEVAQFAGLVMNNLGYLE